MGTQKQSRQPNTVSITKQGLYGARALFTPEIIGKEKRTLP
jgi:hypothetical protein